MWNRRPKSTAYPFAFSHFLRPNHGPLRSPLKNSAKTSQKLILIPFVDNFLTNLLESKRDRSILAAMLRGNFPARRQDVFQIRLNNRRSYESSRFGEPCCHGLGRNGTFPCQSHSRGNESKRSQTKISTRQGRVEASKKTNQTREKACDASGPRGLVRFDVVRSRSQTVNKG